MKVDRMHVIRDLSDSISMKRHNLSQDEICGLSTGELEELYNMLFECIDLGDRFEINDFTDDGSNMKVLH